MLRARSISTRAALRRHPWAITLMESRMAPGPSNLRSHDEMLAVLLDAGFSAAMATHASNLVDSYVLGFALQETSFPFSNAEELAAVGEELLAQVPGDEYPSFVRVGAELLASGFDYADEFEFGLDLILDGYRAGPAGNLIAGADSAGLQTRHHEPPLSAPAVDQLLGGQARPGSQVVSQ